MIDTVRELYRVITDPRDMLEENNSDVELSLVDCGWKRKGLCSK